MRQNTIKYQRFLSIRTKTGESSQKYLLLPFLFLPITKIYLYKICEIESKMCEYLERLKSKS